MVPISVPSKMLSLPGNLEINAKNQEGQVGTINLSASTCCGHGIVIIDCSVSRIKHINNHILILLAQIFVLHIMSGIMHYNSSKLDYGK